MAKSWWNLTWICWKSLKSTPSIYFFAKQLFFFFLPLVNRTIDLVIFFQIFKGFTLLPWQKVGSNLTAICHLLKISKCLMLSFVLDKISSFLLSLYPNDMAPKHLFSKFFLLFFLLFGEKSRYLWHLLRYLRNSYRFGIRFQNGFV